LVARDLIVGLATAIPSTIMILLPGKDTRLKISTGSESNTPKQHEDWCCMSSSTEW
jgi:hypothetical protein